MVFCTEFLDRRWSWEPLRRSCVQWGCCRTATSALHTRPTQRLSRTPYLLTPWCRVLLEKLTRLQLVKKFPAFRGTQRFITALTSVRHLSLSWASPFQSIPTFHLLEIHPNIIHSSMPRPPQWSLSLRFPYQDPIYPPPHPYAPHAQPISFFSILSPTQYWVRSTYHLAPRYAVSSIPPLPPPS